MKLVNDEKRMIDASSSKAKQLDQYYTKIKVAEICWVKLKNILEKIYNLNDCLFLEPSAGYGSFLNGFKSNKNFTQNKSSILNCDIVAYDIEPKSSRIKKLDFLNKQDLEKELIKIKKSQKINP